MHATTTSEVIEIDLEIHKYIESNRLNFKETKSDILKRLLRLTGTQQEFVPSGRSWHGANITLPHGTSFRMQYKSNTYEGQILDGQWVIDGRHFDSPSGAASGVISAKRGKKTLLNGWNYWHVKRPGETQWSALDNRPPTFTLKDLDLE